MGLPRSSFLPSGPLSWLSHLIISTIDPVPVVGGGLQEVVNPKSKQNQPSRIKHKAQTVPKQQNQGHLLGQDPSHSSGAARPLWAAIKIPRQVVRQEAGPGVVCSPSPHREGQWVEGGTSCPFLSVPGTSPRPGSEAQEGL